MKLPAVVTLAVPLALAAAGPAAALPLGPPPGAARPAPVCPLWWSPGEPAALYPHPASQGGEGGGALAEPSGWAAVNAARGWIEVGRPDRALEALAIAPDGAARRLYRLASLDALGRWAELDREARETPASRLPPGCEPLLDLWSARAAIASGRGAEGDRAFGRLAARLPALGAWIEILRLEAAAAAGDTPRGDAAWLRIQSSGLPPVARQDARPLLATLHERAGRLDEAIAWHVTLAAETRGEERARHLLNAAVLADARSDAARADALRRRLLAEEPAFGADLVLDPAARARLAIRPLEAARVLIESGRAALAEATADTVLTSGARPAELQEATLIRARARLARGDRQGADRDYASFLAQWPSDPRGPDVAFDRARLALEGGDGALARQRLEEFRARWPSHEKADDALYLIADSWHDEWDGRDAAVASRAIAAFDRLVAQAPGSYFAERSRMRAAHLAFAQRRYDEAERRYRAYRGPSAREARYWTARALAARGRTEEARGIWRSLASAGDEYYAILSRQRLRGGDLNDLLPSGYAPPPVPAYVPSGDVLLGTSSGRTAAALLALGRRRWAQAELERAAPGSGDRERLRAWAAALEAWGFPGMALPLGVRLGLERFSYPAGYTPSLDREAREHGLDAYWVAALIRQESLYRATAVSPAGARGLMQIMPATGREIAAAETWPDFDESELFDPAVSLHFGFTYLAAQRSRFGGFWPAVLASYNGGPDRVAAWIGFPEREMDTELWVDRIPFKETREYVRKIVGQWAAYRRIYGDSRPSL